LRIQKSSGPSVIFSPGWLERKKITPIHKIGGSQSKIKRKNLCTVTMITDILVRMLQNLFIFTLGAIALAYSSAFLVNSLVRISRKLRFSEFLVGFVLMAVATSLPELLIGVIAAVEGDPLLSLGNVVGSNIADLSIVIGIPILLAGGLVFQSTLRKEELLYMNLAAIAPLILLLDGNLTRLEGVALLFFFVFYMYDLIFHSKAYHRVIEDQKVEGRSFGFELFLFALGSAVLMAAAAVVVGAGESLALAVGIPTILVGVIMIALGTSLPELVFSISSIRHGHTDLSFGNIIGSVVTNATLILGITAVIHPIQLDEINVLLSSSIVLIATLLYFSILVRSGKFAVRDALILVFGYLLFAILEVFLGTLG